MVRCAPKRPGFLRNLITLYSSGKKAVGGIAKIRQGVVAKKPDVGFEGVMDLVGSAGIALMLTPEGMVAGAMMTLGSSLAQSVREFRRSDPLSPAEKTTLALDAGVSLGALLFFIPGGFLPGTVLVGGISAARQVLKRTARVGGLAQALPPA